MNAKATATVRCYNGEIFLRMVRVTSVGRTSVLARLTPSQAERLAAELRRCGGKANPKLKVRASK